MPSRSVATLLRKIGLFGALLLCMSLITPALADESPPTYERGFGTAPDCNLGGWTAYGSATAMIEVLAPNQCIVRIQSLAPAGGTTMSSGRSAGLSGARTQAIPGPDPVTRSVSGITRSFVVTEENEAFQLWLKPYSNRPGTAFAAQTVTLYNANGQIIYTKSRNSTGDLWLFFDFRLDFYRGQTVKAYISTTVSWSTPDTGSPSAVTLYVDEPGSYISPPNPDGMPLPGW